jgi:NAD(P)H-dependent flavin oxidoreductase YrpB (nitropropane dioxygenase family)
MNAVRSTFCQLVGTRVPLQQAAMSRVTTPELVAAVSNAGGLGMLAIGRTPAAQALAQLDAVDALTINPYGAGFIVPFLDRECFDAVVERIDVVELFYGWPDPDLVHPWVPTGWQVGTVDEARAAVDAGCRYVVAQGVEAGGHVRDTVPLAELLPAVRAAVDVPIVAAGGIGSRADADRAFALGADAVRVGTRFLGAIEADVHPRYLELLIAAETDDTVVTGAFSVGWPDAPVRVLASSLGAANEAGPDPVAHMGGMPIPRFGTTPPNTRTIGQIEAMALYAGRSVGDLTAVASAASIVDELVGGRS